MIKLLFIVFSMVMSLVSTAHAEVYRSVDESGNTVFTDKPQKNSEKVDLPGLTTYESLPYKKIRAEKAKKSITGFISYTEFKITSPANKDAIHNPEGNIAVNLLTTPELQVRLGHRIVLYVDGTKVASTTASKYKLTNIDRGSHTLSAQIIDSNGKPLSSLISTTFYLVLVEDDTEKDLPTKKDHDYDPDYDPKSPDYDPGSEANKPKTIPDYDSDSEANKPKTTPDYDPDSEVNKPKTTPNYKRQIPNYKPSYTPTKPNYRP